MSLKIFLEVKLKDTFFFGFAKSLYHFLVKIERLCSKTYIRLIGIFIPSGYFIQKTPSFVKQNYADFKSDELIYHKSCPENQKDGTRIITLKYLLDIVKVLPEGDYAELGTYQGALARLIFKYMEPGAVLYCFDTFEGFAPEDVSIELHKTGDKVKSGFFSDTSEEKVASMILDGNENRKANLKLVKGYFPGTFSGYEDKKWRFVHLDADLYHPMKSGMEEFWDKIVDGGILLMHDYLGTYSGAHQAAEEFFKTKGIQVVPVADTAGSAFVIKQNSK